MAILNLRYFEKLASKNDVQDKRYKSQNFAFVKSKSKFMYSYNDFERLFLRYKLEGDPSGVSIEQFCLSNQVPYNLFEEGCYREL